MPVQIILEGDLQNTDLTNWDNLSVVADMYRDVKADTYIILSELFKKNKLDFIKIVTQGSFEPRLLHDDSGNWRPVVILSRPNDAEQYESLGLECQYLINDGSGNMVDVTDKVLGALPKGVPVNFWWMGSFVTLSIDICTINSQLADQIYGFIKMAMFAARKTYYMDALGYLDIRRIGGGDGQDVFLDDSGGKHVLVTRTLTYSAHVLDFIAGIPQLVSLIQSTFTGLETQPDGSAQESLEL